MRIGTESKCGVTVPIPSGTGKTISPHAFIKLPELPDLVLAALEEIGTQDKPWHLGTSSLLEEAHMALPSRASSLMGAGVTALAFVKGELCDCCPPVFWGRSKVPSWQEWEFRCLQAQELGDGQ